MSAIKQERLTLEAEIKADIATMSDIAEVSLRTLCQYQSLLVTMRRENHPCPLWARQRLLFVCREAREAYKEASRTIASNRNELAKLQHAREVRA